jgi:hypothetical protein
MKCKNKKCKGTGEALLGLRKMCRGCYQKWWHKNIGWKMPERPKYWRGRD